MSGTETLWQELICRLEGVQAAQVVFAENGMPCEIHVLAGPEKVRNRWYAISSLL